ncbi:hypothetical protein M422DRAFT_239381 [Sphaerobolus stellatus SS14]|nr:hypothetical protein M422DRAFT_239381 [Sphaerobolus stellatus SS14]
MLNDDIWRYIAKAYLYPADFPQLSQSCRRLRRVFLPLQFEQQKFAGLSKADPRIPRMYLYHLARRKRRIDSLSEHPEIAIHIRRVQIRRWTDIWRCISFWRKSSGVRDIIEQPFPATLVAKWTSTYQAVIDLARTLPALETLELYEHWVYDEFDTTNYGLLVQPGFFNSEDRILSPWFVKFRILPRSMPISLSMPPVMHDEKSPKSDFSFDYFNHFLTTLPFSVNSIRFPLKLMDSPTEERVEGMKKSVEHFGLVCDFVGDRKFSWYQGRQAPALTSSSRSGLQVFRRARPGLTLATIILAGIETSEWGAPNDSGSAKLSRRQSNHTIMKILRRLMRCLFVLYLLILDALESAQGER